MLYKNKFEKITPITLNEECGIFGIINSKDASYKIYMGLHALQHRGQDASGITTFFDKKIISKKKKGSIVEGFNAEDINELKGDVGIGHVRYPTSGTKDSIKNIQPFIFEINKEKFSICHNGNLTNSITLKKELKNDVKFISDSDSEILGHLMLMSPEKKIIDRLKWSFKKIIGAYSYLIAFEDKLIAARDPNGIRPLILGKKGNEYVFASETSALDINNIDYVKDVEPGEIIIINKNGKIEKDYISNKRYSTICAMEYIYFSRPDSYLEGVNIHEARVKMGIQLAKEKPAKADIVIGVPDSSISASLGYAKQSKISYEYGLIKNKYIGRSFIAPSQQEREKLIKMKLNPNSSVIKGKDIVLVDDSIVRGTTMKGIISLLKKAGANKIHIRIASPEIKYPSFYGINISDKNELALNKYTKEEYRKSLKYANSLEFLSIEGLEKVLNRKYKKKELNLSCFTGYYPIELVDYEEKK